MRATKGVRESEYNKEPNEMRYNKSLKKSDYAYRQQIAHVRQEVQTLEDFINTMDEFRTREDNLFRELHVQEQYIEHRSS